MQQQPNPVYAAIFLVAIIGFFIFVVIDAKNAARKRVQEKLHKMEQERLKAAAAAAAAEAEAARVASLTTAQRVGNAASKVGGAVLNGVFYTVVGVAGAAITLVAADAAATIIREVDNEINERSNKNRA